MTIILVPPLEVTRQVMLVRTTTLPETYDVYGARMGKQHGGVDYITLSNRWQIPLHKAKNMVQQTMQCGV